MKDRGLESSGDLAELSIHVHFQLGIRKLCRGIISIYIIKKDKDKIKQNIVIEEKDKGGEGRGRIVFVQLRR